MYYEIYIDLFFLQQFFLNVSALTASAILLEQRVGKKRILAASAFTALAEAVFCVLPIGVLGKKMGAALPFLWGVLIFVVFHPKKIKGFLTCGLCFLLHLFLFGGMLQFLKRGETAYSFFDFALAGTITLLILFRLRALHRKNEVECTVLLTVDGREKRLNGFWDTGNVLKDPYTGKGVGILGKKAAGRLYGGSPPVKYGIPYTSVGKKGGILYVMVVEELVIEQKQGQIRIPEAELAVSDEMELFCGKYDLLLHSGWCRKEVLSSSKKE